MGEMGSAITIMTIYHLPFLDDPARASSSLFFPRRSSLDCHGDLFTGGNRGNRDLKTFSVLSVRSCKKIRKGRGSGVEGKKTAASCALAFRSVSLALPLDTHPSSPCQRENPRAPGTLVEI
jgi:hypothetical protein